MSYMGIDRSNFILRRRFEAVVYIPSLIERPQPSWAPRRSCTGARPEPLPDRAVTYNAATGKDFSPEHAFFLAPICQCGRPLDYDRRSDQWGCGACS